MNKMLIQTVGMGAVLVVILCAFASHGQATIVGIQGTTFNLIAKEGTVSSPDGGSIHSWGYADGSGLMQYPGPTLILQQGDTITVKLKNELPVGAGNVSIVFPGHQVAATGGVTGDLTQEAPPDGTTVTYTFTASEPGTYTYYSGTNPDLQVEMGLVGAIIVRPTGFDPNNPRAYNHAGSRYDHEVLFLLTEMDPDIHHLVEMGAIDQVDTTEFFPVYWFINGRNFPDTIVPAGVPWLPHQPYECLALMRPGERLVLRYVGGGRDLHPFHPHGNNAFIIARDGRLLASDSDNGLGDYPDLATSVFTIAVAPGSTVDAIFEWTGAKLGWDIYGHSEGEGLQPHEYAPDHGKPFPVTLPAQQDLTLGGLWSGSPFLGVEGPLPPGEGGLNPNAGYAFPWHTHSEKEIVNNDIFIGGMLTIAIVLPPGT